MKKNMLHRVFAGLLAGAMMVMATACSGDSSSGAGSAGGNSSGEDSNFNESGWPVVNEKVTLKVYGSRNSDSLEDWNDYILLQEMEEKTNVHFEFELVESSSYAERRAVKLNSGEYPDVIKDGLTVTEIVRYGKDGLIIPLEDMQEKYCPQLMAAYDSDYGKTVGMKATATMPDGHVYTFVSSGLAPFIGLNRIGCINKDWLDAVDMEVPTTLDEFTEVLRAFKTKDPNGNGKQDELPMSWCGALYSTFNTWDYGLNWLGDSFGVPAGSDLLNVTDGKATFVASTEEYKEFIKWLHELYTEGLLDETGFSQTVDQYKAKLAGDTTVVGVASVWEIGDDFATYDAYDHYVYLDSMKGLGGEEPAPYYNPYDGNVGMWAVTSACQMPEVAVRVADYFYDEAISTEFFEGRRGEPEEVGEETQVRQIPCTECDSETAYMVADPPEGVNTQTFRNKCCPASNFPYVCSTEGYEKYQHLHYTDKKAEKIKAIKEISPDPIGKLNYTSEEADVVNQVQSEIITYANRRAAEWVANGKIDEEWDAYLQELENMRLGEMMKIVQAAQTRFEENMK